MPTPLWVPPSPLKYKSEKHSPLPAEDDPQPVSGPNGPESSSSLMASPPNGPVRPQSPLGLLNRLKGLSMTSDSLTLHDSDSETRLHITLHPRHTRLKLDLSQSQFTLHGSYNVEDLSAPATSPLALSLTLESPRLPFTITISSTTVPYVTVYDVLWGLHSALQQPLILERQKSIPPSYLLAVTQACHNRGGKLPLRVDLLLGFTKFTGLTRRIKDGRWEAVVE